jgi:hypothetical protein
MKTRCPSCGATASLDVLIGHDAASLALSEVFSINGTFGKAIVQYLSLFRSGTRELTFTRVAKLMAEIRPDVIRRQITRDRVDYPAPPEAWIYAIEQTLKARDEGKITLPLTSHGWLYAVITQYKPDRAPAAQESTTSTKTVRRTLRGVSAEDMPAYLALQRRPAETTDEAYNRLLNEQGASH